MMGWLEVWWETRTVGRTRRILARQRSCRWLPVRFLPWSSTCRGQPSCLAVVITAVIITMIIYNDWGHQVPQSFSLQSITLSSLRTFASRPPSATRSRRLSRSRSSQSRVSPIWPLRRRGSVNRMPMIYITIFPFFVTCGSRFDLIVPLRSAASWWTTRTNLVRSTNFNFQIFNSPKKHLLSAEICIILNIVGWKLIMVALWPAQLTKGTLVDVNTINCYSTCKSFQLNDAITILYLSDTIVWIWSY